MPNQATMENLMKLLAEHYPCSVCKGPGAYFVSKGFNACEEHLEQVNVLAKKEHDAFWAKAFAREKGFEDR